VDLTNRLGLGLSQQMGAVDVPMITAHYYPNARFAISGAIGIDTKRDDSKFGVLGKVRRIVFTENQMNFYMGGAAGYSTHDEYNASTLRFEDKNNFEISAVIGGEFFFTGLDSLALMFETGIGVVTGDGGSRFRTIADHPFTAGIIFYF
jgi:hypothetical protein